MNTTVLSINCGTLELRQSYPKYAAEALIIAAFIHILIIGGFRAYMYFASIDETIPTIRITTRYELLPQTSIAQTKNTYSVSVAMQNSKPSIGMYVPVPDAEINPDATVATPAEMNQLLGNELGNENGAAAIFEIIENVAINEDEKEPEPFKAVEKEPIAVSAVHPQYPEIARKAGVEGTVWVKMWITKEGKVKRAEILKSDSPLFSQPALDAAQQWIFTPAVMNNGPVSVWVTVPFRFRLTAR